MTIFRVKSPSRQWSLTEEILKIVSRTIALVDRGIGGQNSAKVTLKKSSLLRNSTKFLSNQGLFAEMPISVPI